MTLYHEYKLLIMSHSQLSFEVNAFLSYYENVFVSMFYSLRGILETVAPVCKIKISNRLVRMIILK